MADTEIDAGPAARPAKTGLSTDARWIVSTGMTIAALLVALVGMMFQQNAMLMQQYATINARIDDTNTSISARIDDTNRRIDDTNRRIDHVQTDMREMRSEIQTEFREIRSEIQTEFREVRSEIREIRSLLLQIIEERTAPAD